MLDDRKPAFKFRVGEEESGGEKGRVTEEGRTTGHHKPFGRSRKRDKDSKYIGVTALTFEGHVTSSIT